MNNEQQRKQPNINLGDRKRWRPRPKTKKEFKYEMGDEVRLVKSHEVGTVVGRAENFMGQDSFLILYRANDGRQTRAWWEESELEAN